MTTYFEWDTVEDNIFEEFDDAGATIAAYTTEPYLYGDLVSQRRSGQSRFYHFDGLGSTTELSDDIGTITDTRQYTGFGETTESTGNTAFPFQFLASRGGYLDNALSDYTSHYLWYRPILARSLTKRRPRFHSEDDNPYVYLRYPGASATRASLPRGVPKRVRSQDFVLFRGFLGDSDNEKAKENEKPDQPKQLGQVAHCPEHFQLINRPGFESETNGCSVPEQLRIIIRNKDRPIGGISFLDACNAHDECYQSCRTVKETCDTRFYDAMVAACMAAPDPELVAPCKDMAAAYYGAVRDFGFTAWNDSQQKACLCCKLCDPDVGCVGVTLGPPAS